MKSSAESAIRIKRCAAIVAALLASLAALHAADDSPIAGNVTSHSQGLHGYIGFSHENPN